MTGRRRVILLLLDPPVRLVDAMERLDASYAFVWPHHRDRLGRVTSREDLVAANDLYSIAAPRRHPR